MEWIQRWDKAGFRFLHQALHRDWLDPVFWALSYSGLGQVQAVGILLLALWPNTRRCVLPLLASLAVSGLALVPLAKTLVPRDRPSLLPWVHTQEPFQFHSFPSGHTTTSFAIAFVLLAVTRGTSKAWVGPWALVWATLVGVSRCYRGVHWPTDVVGGALLGLAGACVALLVFPRRDPQPSAQA
ncbi:MAG: phosphatase PAP2 family protein [Fimbriimonas ginsengisoli]|uniref:Phosphatase PAP2 family protein n=1 Tax=Fimbriimonas ginsengisoli TaxID=1005039 RepID=A0A931PVZ9_FIMGI|nr:phosphatase PAP2 family protein [Fimbriimonas ginsengisoli]